MRKRWNVVNSKHKRVLPATYKIPQSYPCSVIEKKQKNTPQGVLLTTYRTSRIVAARCSIHSRLRLLALLCLAAQKRFPIVFACSQVIRPLRFALGS